MDEQSSTADFSEAHGDLRQCADLSLTAVVSNGIKHATAEKSSEVHIAFPAALATNEGAADSSSSGLQSGIGFTKNGGIRSVEATPSVIDSSSKQDKLDSPELESATFNRTECNEVPADEEAKQCEVGREHVRRKAKIEPNLSSEHDRGEFNQSPYDQETTKRAAACKSSETEGRSSMNASYPVHTNKNGSAFNANQRQFGHSDLSEKRQRGSVVTHQNERKAATDDQRKPGTPATKQKQSGALPSSGGRARQRFVIKFQVVISSLFNFNPQNQRFMLKYAEDDKHLSAPMETRQIASSDAFLATVAIELFSDALAQRFGYSYACVDRTSEQEVLETSLNDDKSTRVLYLTRDVTQHFDWIAVPHLSKESSYLTKMYSKVKDVVASAIGGDSKTEDVKQAVFKDVAESFIIAMPALNAMLDKDNRLDCSQALKSASIVQQQLLKFVELFCKKTALSIDEKTLIVDCFSRYFRLSMVFLAKGKDELNVVDSLSIRLRRLNLLNAALSLLLFAPDQHFRAIWKASVDSVQTLECFFELLLLFPRVEDVDTADGKHQALRDELAHLTGNAAELRKRISFLFKECEEKNLPYGLYLLPVHHCLNNWSALHGCLKVERHNANSATWWGIGDQLKKYFDQQKIALNRSHQQSQVMLVKLYAKLKPIFHLFPLLPRSFVALLDCESLTYVQSQNRCELPPEAIVAAVYYYIVSTKERRHKEQVVSCCCGILSGLTSDSKRLRSTFTEHNLANVMNVCTDLVKELSYSSWSLPATEQEFQLLLEIVKIFIELHKTEPRSFTHHNFGKIFGEAMNAVVGVALDRLNRASYDDCGGNLQSLVALYAKLEDAESAFEQWSDRLVGGFAKYLGRLNNSAKVTIYVAQDSSTWPRKLHEIFNNSVLEVMQSGLRDGNTDLLKYVSVEQYKKRSLYTSLIDRCMPERYDSANQFFRLIRDGAVARLLQLVLLDRQSLPHDSQMRLAAFESCLTAHRESIISGEILARDFQMFSECSDFIAKFVEVLETCREGAPELPQFLMLRKKQLDAFVQQDKCIREFVRRFAHFRGMELLKSSLEADWSTKPLNQLSVVVNVSKTETSEAASSAVCPENFSLMVTWHKIDNAWLEKVLIPFTTLHESQLLNTSLGKFIDDVQGGSLDDLFQLFLQALSATRRQVETLFDGSIRFADLALLFANQRSQSSIQKELRLWKDEAALCEKTAQDIMQAFRNFSCLRGAEVVKQVYQTYFPDVAVSSFSAGSHELFEHLTNEAELNTASLGEIASWSCQPEALEISSKLAALDQLHIECLYAFIQAKNLVDWLVTNVGTAKDFRTLIDLAQISAGDGDAELGKVECVEHAVNGFESLIFSFLANKQTKHEVKKLLLACEPLWRNLASDSSLAKKLREASRYKSWLAEIKSTHGSVEMTALQQAELLVSSGVFTLSGSQKLTSARGAETDAPAANKQLTLDDVLWARVATASTPNHQSSENEPEAKSEQRVYTYTELRDLLDKLMLIAGNRCSRKKLDSVETFLLIFTKLECLAREYLSLTAAGTLLFDSFKASFYCSADAVPRCILDSGLEKQVLKLNFPVIEVVSKLTAVFEQCLAEWNDYVDATRDKYDELNHLTVKQLVTIRRELFNLKSGKTCDERFLSMVAAATGQNNDTRLGQELREALKSFANTLLASMPVTSEKQASVLPSSLDVAQEQKDADTTENQEWYDQLSVFISDSNIIRRVLARKNDFESFAAALEWCSQQDDSRNDDSETGNSDEDDNQISTSDQPSAATSAAAQNQNPIVGSSYSFSNAFTPSNFCMGDEGVADECFSASIRNSWLQYLAETQASLEGYVSLDQLGRVLQHLRQSMRSMNTVEALKNSINKKRLHFLDMDRLNILWTSEHDMLNTLLGLYAYATDGRSSRFPSADEVLVCSGETSSEQLELFWRRALFSDDDSKLYAAAYADRLARDVLFRAEKKLKRLVDYRPQNRAFQLVLLLSREHGDLSAFTYAFNCRRIDVNELTGILPNESGIRTYLKQHMMQHRALDEDQALEDLQCLDSELCTVRVVRSMQAGMGKSLYVQRCTEKLAIALGKQASGAEIEQYACTVQVYERRMEADRLVQALLAPRSNEESRKATQVRMVHVDLGRDVHENVDPVLFEMLVLGRLTASDGSVWLKSKYDVVLVEHVPLYERVKCTGNKVKDTGPSTAQNHKVIATHRLLELLPRVECRSPLEILQILRANPEAQSSVRQNYYEQLLDDQLLKSDSYGKPASYLALFTANQQQLQAQLHQRLSAAQKSIGRLEFLQVVLANCGLAKPSWSELSVFLSFLETQFLSFERSDFCNDLAEQDLPGFCKFVVRFLIQMSRDFATRSLNIAEETPTVHANDEESSAVASDLLQEFSLKRTWESSSHPYLFFNEDGHSFTFLGFRLTVEQQQQQQLVHLLDEAGRLIERDIMRAELCQALISNGVVFNEQFDNLTRLQKLARLVRVLSATDSRLQDADETYELTADNVKKLLAIYMRLRSNIPVIVMGETGCGKTRMIKFLCDLLLPRELVGKTKNLYVVKVHGGVTTRQLERVIEKADAKARTNVAFGIDTYVFLDEVNSSEAVGMVKQVMCDRRVGGLVLTERLKVICACNPYRKHSENVIRHLETVGLGYHVRAENALERFGQTPMRQLVYRVKPLPPSLVPFCWDFGQLPSDVERIYIDQLVTRAVNTAGYEEMVPYVSAVSGVLHRSQIFMREQLDDECFFVSLRDVSRALEVLKWFYSRRAAIFSRMKATSGSGAEASVVARCLVLAVCVCYYVSLQSKRREFVAFVLPTFTGPLRLSTPSNNAEAGQAAALFTHEFEACQEVFLRECEHSIPDGIAYNEALRENVFMMIVCIELGIPLFLVGKPGSSKSLAKQIVHDALQGEQSRSNFFKDFKKITMLSYQCSPLSTADGIIGTFRQAARFQKEKDLSRFCSVVVLDEIGLAEDSQNMPLKALHALLETGVAGYEEERENDKQTLFSWDAQFATHAYKRVAFIGISNWALDPAKTNRGILMQRSQVDYAELVETARGICGDRKTRKLESILKPLAKAYVELCEQLSEQKEFFGLRDYYALIKMLLFFATASTGARSCRIPDWQEIQYCILRNFDGLDSRMMKPVELFAQHLRSETDLVTIPAELPSLSGNGPDCSALGILKSALSRSMGQSSNGGLDFEARYLLLMTENFASLRLILQREELANDANLVTVFGSKFSEDLKFTQICCYINQIKMAMEVGSTVILLNLSQLYESLYDALNQYYSFIGDDRYVDLGLGTQRLKCKVHRRFKLIVLAHESTVLETFPIPLINRLEKHKFSLGNLLTSDLKEAAERVIMWCEDMRRRYREAGGRNDDLSELFVGYTDETASFLVLNEQCVQAKKQQKQLAEASRLEVTDFTDVIVAECCKKLQRCMPLDVVMRMDDSHLIDDYFYEQGHRSLHDVLQVSLRDSGGRDLFLHVTTFSHVLTEANLERLSRSLFDGCSASDTIRVCPLQQFESLQKFNKFLEVFISNSDEELLILQCDHAQANSELIECAQYAIEDAYAKFGEKLATAREEQHTSRCADVSDKASSHQRSKPVRIVLLLYLVRRKTLRISGFPCGIWTSFHLDELFAHSLYDTNVDVVNDVVRLRRQTIGDLLAFEDAPAITSGPDGEAPVNVIELVRQCIPGAVSMIQYSCVAVSSEIIDRRKADLIRALTRVFSATDSVATTNEVLKFRRCFVKRLRELSTEDEEKRHKLQILSEHWTAAASREDVLTDFGTYQQTVIAILKSRVKPLVGALVALLDEGGQLKDFICRLVEDVLATSDVSVPAMQLWLSFLDDSGVANLNYDDALKLANIHTGVLTECSNFLLQLPVASIVGSGRFPFANLVHRKLVELTTVSAETVGQQAGPEESFTAQCEEFWLGFLHTPIYRVTKSARLENVDASLWRAYLRYHLSVTFESATDDLDAVCDIVDEEVRFVDRKSQIFRSCLTKSEMNAAESLGLLFRALDDCTDELLRCIALLHLLDSLLKSRLDAFLISVEQVRSSPALFAQKEAQEIEIIKKLKARPNREEILINFDLLATEDLLQRMLESGKQSTQDLTAAHANNEGTSARVDRWLNSVHRINLVVEASFDVSSQELNWLVEKAANGGFKADEMRSSLLQRCRGMLNRLLLMHTLLQSMQSTIGFSNPDLAISLFRMNFQFAWASVEKHSDFSKKHSFEFVHKLLQSFSETACKYLFGLSVSCALCEKKQMIVPVVLTCKHVLCRICLTNLSRDGISKCPQCKEAIADDVQSFAAAQNEGAYVKYKRFQEFANRFIVEVALRLVFTSANLRDGTIHKDVYQRFVGFVTNTPFKQQLNDGDQPAQVRTKEFSVYDDIFDPDPVFRSFVLKLVLRASGDQTLEFIKLYLQQAVAALASSSRNSSLIDEIHAMCVCCIEDFYIERSFDSDWIEFELRNLAIFSQVEVEQSCGDSELDVVRDLRLISFIRVILDRLADCSGAVLNSKKDGALPLADASRVDQLLHIAQTLCENPEKYSELPKQYFLRAAFRKLGLTALRSLLNTDEFDWLASDDRLQETSSADDDEAQDLFLVYGDVYARLKQAWCEFLFHRNLESLRSSITAELTSHPEETPFIFYLVFASVNTGNSETAARSTTIIQGVGVDNITALLDLFPANCQEAKRLCASVIRDTATTPALVEPRAIYLLASHFSAVAGRLVDKPGLLRPFAQLTLSPETMRNCYLPSMPSDHFEETRNLMVPVPGLQLRLYACSNGHPYWIGDCGLPAVNATCVDCGIRIGGQDHQLAENNQLIVNPVIRNYHGHILGEARFRQQLPVPERQLSPTATVTLRLLTHLAMYTAAQCEEKLESVRNLISVGQQAVFAVESRSIEAGNVKQFLLDHLLIDMRLLSTVLSKNEDETHLFVHSLLRNLVEQQQKINNEAADWTTVQSRDKFEVLFVQHYITPLLNNLPSVLGDAQQRIVDTSHGANQRLLRFLYELETEESNTAAVVRPLFNPSFWRFRQSISIESFERYVENTNIDLSTKTVAFLQHFLRRIRVLEQLKHLPGLLRLQSVMSKRCSRRWSVETAQTLEIGAFLQSSRGGDEQLEEWIDRFIELWNLFREDVKAFAFGGWRLPAKYSDLVMSRDEPVEFLLPSLKGAGICIVMLTAWLIEEHNQLVRLCAAANENESVPTVKVGINTLSIAETISFDAKLDVLAQCIQRNCTYTVKCSERQHEADVTFDVRTIVEEIVDRFVRNKPFLHYSVPSVVYLEEMADTEMFLNLNRYIKQVELGPEVRNAIRNEMRHVARVTEVLGTTTLVMRLVTTMQIDTANVLLTHFLKNMGITSQLWSRTITNTIKLEHLMWLQKLLMFHKVCLIQESGKNVFENVSQRLQAPIESEEAKQVITHALRTNQMDSSTMLNLLLDAINWHKTPEADRSTRADHVNVDYALSEFFENFLDLGDSVDGVDNNFVRLQVELVPKSILVRNIVHLWILIHSASFSQVN